MTSHQKDIRCAEFRLFINGFMLYVAIFTECIHTG